jgi:hypothetical protein
VLGWAADPGRDQDRAEFVAVQPGGMGLIIHAGAPDMGGRGMLDQVFLHGVPVEPRDRAQPAGDGGAGPAAGFHITGEALDVGAAGLEQAQVALLAPARILAQVQRVGLTGQAGITGQEPGQRQPLVAGKYRFGDGNRGGCGRCGGGQRVPPGSG